MLKEVLTKSVSLPSSPTSSMLCDFDGGSSKQTKKADLKCIFHKVIQDRGFIGPFLTICKIQVMNENKIFKPPKKWIVFSQKFFKNTPKAGLDEI